MSRTIQNQQNLKKQQQAALMEQRYYVLQDLDNVLGIFAETAEVIKFFEEFPDHQMVTNAQNRFIAQVNISNYIHFDQKNDHNPLLAGNLKDLKTLAKEYFKELRQSIPFTDKIDHVADHYMNQNLDENNILQQLNGVKSNSTAEFNAKTLQKIIDSMNQMDTLMGNIRAGQKVDIPTKDQFLQKMKARQLNAQNQLKQNFKKEYQESLNKKELKLKNNLNKNVTQDEDEEKIQIDVDEQQISQENINQLQKKVVIEAKQLTNNPISQPNRGIITHLNNLHKEIQCKPFNISALNQIISKMKSEMEIKGLILIFQKIQKQFNKTSEMFYLFNQLLETIQKQNSYIDLTQIDRARIQEQEIMQLKDHIKTLELAQQGVESQNQETTENIPQNNQHGSENDQQANIINMKFIEDLKSLLKQFNYQKFSDQSIQQIIESMKKNLQTRDLILIFQKLQTIFVRTSEMSILFDRIIKSISDQYSRINLSVIQKSYILANEIQQLQDYIDDLEQQVKRQETQNQQQRQIEKQTQNKSQNGFENGQINSGYIQNLKQMYELFLRTPLSVVDLQNIIENMRKDIQFNDLILKFQKIQEIFDQKSQMFKFFGLIIKGISDQQTRINLSGTNSLKLQAKEINQFYNYIQNIELQAKRQEIERQDSQQILDQTQNVCENNSENVQEIKIRNQPIIYHLSQLYTQLYDQKYFNDPQYQQIIASMKNEIQMKDLIKIFEEIQNLFIKNSEMYILFDKIIKDIPKKNSTINLSNIDRARIQDKQITQLYNYIIKLKQDQQVEENQNQGSTEKTSQNTYNRSENDQQINIQKLKIIEDLKSLHQQFTQSILSDQYIQQIIKSMKKNMEAKDLIQIFQEIQKLFDKDSHMFKLFGLIIKSIQDQYTNLNLTGIYRSYIQDYEINRLSKYIRENEEWLRQQK